MSKILKNNTASPVNISDVGQQVPASGQLVIQVSDYSLYAASDDIVPLIGDLTLTVNDGYNDLSSTDGVNFIKYPDEAFNIRFLSGLDRSNGFVSKEVQSAIEESRNSGIGTVTDFHFTSGGSNVSNAWLAAADPSAPSNEVPLIAPQNMDVKGVTFSNKDDSSNTDIELYKNNILQTTVQIRDKRFFWSVGSSLFSMVQGDRLSIFLKKNGSTAGSPSKPVVSVFCKFTNESALVGGKEFGD